MGTDAGLPVAIGARNVVTLDREPLITNIPSQTEIARHLCYKLDQGHHIHENNLGFAVALADIGLAGVDLSKMRFEYMDGASVILSYSHPSGFEVRHTQFFSTEVYLGVRMSAGYLFDQLQTNLNGENVLHISKASDIGSAFAFSPLYHGHDGIWVLSDNLPYIQESNILPGERWTNVGSQCGFLSQPSGVDFSIFPFRFGYAKERDQVSLWKYSKIDH